ncbi:hypothetical protein C7445_109124 [Alicyclobacillus sacchari]|uniref:Uncharacterized protein n=1 Tax=Alicyclobacillus sacchari TaxID=392010 RepID=A0A4R8LKE0_9BACL|nr:hypothetical protein C7445_109124 [Alicyclobacillus sacchari]GMA57987.1 hypothetical protein GCM10025858_24900 [Alicyclobacillus sacchari]
MTHRSAGWRGGIIIGTIVGDILTGVLVVIYIISHKKQGNFRGIWLQVLGALFVGWDINLLLNIRTAPMNPIGAIVFVGFLAVLFYVLGGLRGKK